MNAPVAKLRQLRGTGATQWVATCLETRRADGLVMRADRFPAASAFAGQWDSILELPMPNTAKSRCGHARHFVPGVFTDSLGAMNAAERCAAGIGDVRAVLAFLNAAPLLARLWWGRRETAEPLPFVGCAECGGDFESCTCSLDGPRERGLP